MIVHSMFCFTLLFVCVLQGNMGETQLEHGMNCHLTGLHTNLQMWLGHGVQDGDMKNKNRTDQSHLFFKPQKRGISKKRSQSTTPNSITS